MLGPAQFFKHSTAGAGNKVGEVKDDNNIGGKHHHKGEGREKGRDPEPFKHQQNSYNYFQGRYEPCNYSRIGTEQGRLCQLAGEGFKIQKLAYGRIEEEQYK